MSLFQIQVERQFLAGIATDLATIYKKYVEYFGNPTIQTNILEVTEEQYQGEFIRALFVDILGYTAQPHPNFNLIREKKNETDAKSADAAISINNQIVAVIELKDHKTQDLKKVETQAFGYKNNHKNCHYVITSNFERLRFYIDNAVDFIEFDLFNLTFDEFRRLWLCLSHESMAKNLAQEIKQQSVSNEDIITKQLYKDYSIFKRLLFDSIIDLNPDYDKLLLFKKTQKLLDRFLFLLFAEDKDLLPANSVKGTVEKWKKFNADPMNDYQSLYSRFVRYFKLLDEGYKDANIEIYAYNGGLFANDVLLNQIMIDDTILSENVLKLAAYDYGTDVDVNILGHIFENSLNEIEQVANEITTGEKITSKRKQDGVFYTPRYITQYIVENTIGRLCEEKKAELGIGEELFEYKRADKKKQALKIFDDYREWLLHITIVDPACGSGAFLNSALDFLIAEHKWIDNQQDKITGSKDHYSMGLSNIENTILENNLFGVDINEESVEIAKLSLWLRTAKPHRKLSSLNNNIKCGNSLIDDPAVAGEKAFNWQCEFPQVFKLKNKKIWHVTWVTHDTRTSSRMIKYKVREFKQNGEGHIDRPYYFDEKEAIEITRIISEIIVENQFNCLEYNVCNDHIHIILVCDEEELPNIVRKLKGKSAQKFKEYLGVDREETFHLWAQKFDRNCILSDAELQTKINYIRTNREKHGLPDINKGLQQTVNYSSTGANQLPNINKGLQQTVNCSPTVVKQLPNINKELQQTVNYSSTGANQLPDINKGLQQTVNCSPTVVNQLPNINKELQQTVNYSSTGANQLPDINKGLQPLVERMRSTMQFAFRPEYKGGFDVVIGNPPYGVSFNDIEKKYLSEFDHLVPDYEIYIYFISLYKNILKENGLLSYIFPNTFLSIMYGKKYRENLLKSVNVSQIVDLSNDITFVDASVRTCIFTFKNKLEDFSTKLFKMENKAIAQVNIYSKQDLINNIENLHRLFSINQTEEFVIKKLKEHKTLNKFYEVSQGLIPYDKYRGHDEYTIKNRIWHSDYKKDETYKRELKGGDVNRYYTKWNGNLWISYGDWLAAPREQKYFVMPRILIREITGDSLFCNYLEDEYYNTPSLINIINTDNTLHLKYTLTILNSKLIGWFHNKTSPKANKGLFPKILVNDVRSIPLVEVSTIQQQPFISMADTMLSYNKELQLLVGKFRRMLQRKFELEELPVKLQNWYLLSYKEFIVELGKKKVKLSLAQEAEWEDYFTTERSKVLEIKKQIDDTDREIDRMVYALYELTEEEVKIVEGKNE